MYQALYRKYRPACFADVCGQEHVTVTLRNQLKNGAVSHAYLFTGPRGTGKTSCAKIFAKAVNCLDPREGDACCECDACRGIAAEDNLDITEIDAASNNGVDNIRDLRNSVNYTPANSKYRVYIIDEVHMLSAGAFNALLKTLEEPPAHVIFILATTEVQKLPATIVSRCQRFDFHRLDPAVITARLREVAQKESVSLTDDAAALLAALSDGGMRDALSMLDLCAAYSDTVTDAVVQAACAVAGKERLAKLVDRLIEKDAGGALGEADALWRDSVDMQRLCEELIEHFRHLMILKTVADPKTLLVATAAELERYRAQAALLPTEDILFAIRLLGDALTRMNTANRRAELEMALIKLCNPSLCDTAEALAARIGSLERKLAARIETAETPKPVPEKAEKPEPIPVPEDEPLPVPPETPEDEPLPPPEEAPAETAITPPPAADPAAAEPEAPAPADQPKKLAAWEEILAELGKTCPLLLGVLRDSCCYRSGDYLLIDAPNEQFLPLIKQDIYRDRLRAAAAEVLGKPYKLGPYKGAGAAASAAPDLLGALTGRLTDLGVPDQK